MEDLTFGEQVKIILGRKGMTIKELAETIEARTGKKMSRQNLTQRLGRDNFQEQDMRMIAAILECPFQLSIMGGETAKAPARAAYHEKAETEVKRPETTEGIEEEKHSEAFSASVQPEGDSVKEAAKEIPESAPVPEDMPEQEPEIAISAVQEDTEEPQSTASDADTGNSESAPGEEQDERDMTIGELYEIHEELSELEENAKAGEPVEAIKEELEKPKKERFGNFFLRRRHSESDKKETKETKESNASHEVRLSDSADAGTTVKKQDRKTVDFEPVISHEDAEEDRELGEVNPYTGKEYQSNSVRMHPSRIGYVQVYDRSIHKWTDMTEWAFLGYQERKKALLGKAYEPPIYLD